MKGLSKNLDDYPELKKRLPQVPDGTAILSYGFIRKLTDGEFIVLCNCDFKFRVNNKTMELVQKRINDLSINHSTGLVQNEININTN